MHINRKKYFDSTLAQFGHALNSAGLLWGVGASAMLQRYGLADYPNDIDIIVAEKDIDKADKILSTFGKKEKFQKSDIYATDHFYEYHLDKLDIDLISGYKIILPDGNIFTYSFDQASVPTFFEVEGIKIPFTTLEDWYVLYLLMPNREQKAANIEKYLKENGISHPELLERILENKYIPDAICKRIKNNLLP